MSTPLFTTPVTSAEAEAALPYHGDSPAELSAVADRISDARTFLARINDALFDARSKFAVAWQGDTATIGEREVNLLLVATERGVGRLDRARSAVLDCSDLLSDTRSAIDALRPQWRQVEQKLRDAAREIQHNVEPLRLPGLQHQLLVHGMDSAELTRSWQAEVDRADRGTRRCRRRLERSLAGEQVYAAGTGVMSEGLGAALGTDQLAADDSFRAASIDDREQWDRLSDSTRAFALASAGVFPPPGASTPAELATSWRGLSPMERQALIESDPALIGSLDGLPAAARDQANRTQLAVQEASITAGLAALPPVAPTAVYTSAAGMTWADTSGYWQYLDGAASVTGQQRAALGAQLANLRSVQDQLVPAAVPPRLLLGFSLQGRGRAIVAVGDPDAAANVATFVPGTSSDLGSLASDVGRAQAMRDAAVQAGALNTAVVTWIGYESPPGVGSAGFDSYADAGAPQLVAFQQGLRAGHLGPPSLNTVVAHSYAGLVVAGAATGGSVLDADQVILVASAGLEVPSSGQLQLAGVPSSEIGDHVFSTVVANDLINGTALVHHGMPTSPDFGATGFASDPYPQPVWGQILSVFTAAPGAVAAVGGLPVSGAGHSAYWDPGSASLRGMGQIIAGAGPG